jgi:hypothetical protein
MSNCTLERDLSSHFRCHCCACSLTAIPHGRCHVVSILRARYRACTSVPPVPLLRLSRTRTTRWSPTRPSGSVWLSTSSLTPSSAQDIPTQQPTSHERLPPLPPSITLSPSATKTPSNHVIIKCSPLPLIYFLYDVFIYQPAMFVSVCVG